MKNTPLGKKVKIKLIELNMNQVDLAKKLKTSPQNLNSVLSGKPSLNIEEKLIMWLNESRKNKIRTSSKHIQARRRR